MPPRLRANPYRGINAHLHSDWQAHGGWGSFHTSYIVNLSEWLNEQLEDLGYVARVEESLQVRFFEEDLNRLRADVLISDTQPSRFGTNPAWSTAMPLLDLLEPPDEEHPYHAVAIYPIETRAGDAVAWLELLSPSNKGETLIAGDYQGKRQRLLERGIVYVELDYLHETPPSFPRLPDYSRGEPNAHPYRIIVIDPRPEWRQGYAHIEGFGVDDPLPTLVVPLAGNDVVEVDFNAPYHETLLRARYPASQDYHRVPVHFERYQRADQARIALRMLAIRGALERGDDLSQPPPLPQIEPEAALAQVMAWQGEA